jgi:cathepsin A (carboxypeptidase C)/serine carboxypeptidase-like clade 2
MYPLFPANEQIWDMGYSVSGSKWVELKVNGQTGGYLTKWKNTKMGFLTIHHAGHEVPTYQPIVAYAMWQKFLSGVLTNA